MELAEGDDSGYFRGNLTNHSLSDFVCEIRYRVRSATTGTVALTFGDGVGGPRNEFSIGHDGSDRFRLTNSSGKLPTGALSLRKNDWHSLHLVVRGRTASGYFDGIPVGAPVAVDPQTTLPAKPGIYVRLETGTVCEVDHFILWDLTKPVDPPSPPTASTEPAPTAGPATAPKWLFAENSRRRYRIVDSEDTRTSRKSSSPIRQLTAVQAFEVTVKASAVDPRGAATLVVTVDRVGFASDWLPSINVNSGTSRRYVSEFRHDTQGTVTAADEVKSWAEPLENLVGATLTMRMMPDGRILNLRASPAILTVKSTDMQDMMGNAPWTADRLQRSLMAWAVSLPDATELKKGRWSRVTTPYFRPDTAGETAWFTLKPPGSDAPTTVLVFDGSYRSTARRSVGADQTTYEGPTATFVIDTANGSLKSARRTYSIESNVGGTTTVTTLSNSVEEL
jgi:hypothetical protein